MSPLISESACSPARSPTPAPEIPEETTETDPNTNARRLSQMSREPHDAKYVWSGIAQIAAAAEQGPVVVLQDNQLTTGSTFRGGRRR